MSDQEGGAVETKLVPVKEMVILAARAWPVNWYHEMAPDPWAHGGFGITATMRGLRVSVYQTKEGEWRGAVHGHEVPACTRAANSLHSLLRVLRRDVVDISMPLLPLVEDEIDEKESVRRLVVSLLRPAWHHTSDVYAWQRKPADCFDIAFVIKLTDHDAWGKYHLVLEMCCADGRTRVVAQAALPQGIQDRASVSNALAALILHMGGLDP